MMKTGTLMNTNTNTNTDVRHTVPASIGSLLSRLPRYPGSMLLVTGLNFVLARQLPDDVGQVLDGKRIRIQVRDAQLNFDFVWRHKRFCATAPQAQTDLTLSANAHDFLRLAQRLDDPDTLFFNRRLSMEGDTELGLVVKNALDALELPVFDWETVKPSAVLGRLMPGLKNLRTRTHSHSTNAHENH